MNKFLATLAAATLIGSTLAAAQSVTYQWTDPKTGGTIISDKAPPADATDVVKWMGNTRNEDQPLTYGARQAAEKYPVTLFTAASCVDACKQARDLLNGRGVPFTEQMLKSDEEIAALSKRLGSDATVPSIFVGKQSYKGVEAGAWNNLLDLAGYPKSAAFGAKPSGAFSE